MGRKRTVSNLQRETGISRPTIGKHAKHLNLKYNEDYEYTLDDWELLKADLGTIAKNKIIRKKTILPIITKNKTAAKKITTKNLSKDEISTLSERLLKAKSQYNYNDNLIATFQNESDSYVRENGTTNIVGINGSISTISTIVQLEKYVKLNIALSKQITDLETLLDLSNDNGVDPFA